MKYSIFYSWQSDLAGAANRSFIQRALEYAAAELQKEDVTVEPVVDRDTAGVGGSPDIATTIFKKIEDSAVFVADVSIINGRSRKRPTPNPNILVELGFALKALGEDRIIMVMNDIYGGPERLPFDLRTRRVVRYTSNPDDTERAAPRKQLVGRLKTELRVIFAKLLADRAAQKPNYLVKYRYKWRPTRIESNVHEYSITFYVKNEGAVRAEDYRLEVDFPTTYLYDTDKGTGYRRFLFNQDQYRGSAQRIIYPDEEREAFKIDYYVDTRNFTPELLRKAIVRIALYAGDMTPAKEELPITSIQEF